MVNCLQTRWHHRPRVLLKPSASRKVEGFAVFSPPPMCVPRPPPVAYHRRFPVSTPICRTPQGKHNQQHNCFAGFGHLSPIRFFCRFTRTPRGPLCLHPARVRTERLHGIAPLPLDPANGTRIHCLGENIRRKTLSIITRQEGDGVAIRPPRSDDSMRLLVGVESQLPMQFASLSRANDTRHGCFERALSAIY